MVALSSLAPRAMTNEIVPVSSVTSNGGNTFPGNPPAVLVSDAQGDYNYSPPNPGSGGGGTSWHTSSSNGVPAINLTFNFAGASKIRDLVLWDYYGHTPADWTLKLFAGVNGTGGELLSHDFSINTFYVNYNPTRWDIDVANTDNVGSAVLSTRSNSYWGGVGLSEVAFVVPEPASAAMIALGCAACAMAVRQKR